LSPDQITTVAWAICAERCFAAGKPEAAARLAAYANAQKWTLPVAQLEPDAARVGSWTRYFQHSFMVAHELCHLAFRIDEQQKRAAISEHSGEIRKVLDDGTVLKSKSTGPIELSERLRSMEARGYRVTDSARKLAEYPGLFPEPKPWVITKVGIWDSVRDNEAFLEECAADAWALFTLFDVSRPRKEPIQAWGALVALLNLGVIQRLDGIAAGSALRSVREDPHDDVWAARIRVMALKNWATAMIVQHKGEAEARRYLEMYKYSSERYHVTLDDTLDLGMDLNEMLRLRRSNPEEADAVEHWTRSITSLRTLLGFPLANRRSSVHWYINYAIGEPSSAPDATTPWPVQIDAMPES
jgi:hypothetical protein